MKTVSHTQASLEAELKGEIIRMYQEVADHPEGDVHVFHGREAADQFGYAREWLDEAPQGAVDSFAGIAGRLNAGLITACR